MNNFLVSKIIRSCEKYFETGNSITDVVRYKKAGQLLSYAKALDSDSKALICLSIEDIDFIAGIYATI